MRDKVIIGDRLGTNKAALKISMDYTRSLRSGVAFVNGPSTNFFDAGSEIGLQPQQIIGGADDTVEARFRHAHVFKEHFLVGVVKVGNIRLCLGTNGYDRRMFLRCKLTNGVKKRVVREAMIFNVGHIHGGLHGQKE